VTRGPRRAGIDIDDVDGFEHDSRAIAVHHADMRRLRKIRRSTGGELAIVFDRHHPPRSADQLRENRRVKARQMIFSSGSRSIWAAWRVSRSRPRITWPVHRFAGKERVMALRRGFSSILKTGLRGSER
jgi:hypothetical protein